MARDRNPKKPGVQKNPPKRNARRGDVAPGVPGKQIENPAGKGGPNYPGEGLNNPPGKGPANPVGACPEGFVWDVATKKCVRRKGSDAKPRGGCPDGYYWDAEAQRCRKLKDDPGGCPEGFVWNARTGACVPKKSCPEGMVFKNGQCVYPEQGYCPDGYHLDANGQCVQNKRGNCEPGYVWDEATGRCVFDVDAEPGDAAHPCGEGTVWDEDLQMCVPSTEEDDRPPQPSYAPDSGYEWTWDGSQWVQTLTSSGSEKLRATLKGILDQFGLGAQGNIDLIEQAVREDWSPTKFVQELRRSGEYLANPLFKANMDRAAKGLGFKTEGEVIDYANTTRQFFKEFGYGTPDISYISEGLLQDLSPSEIRHRLEIRRNIDTFGGGVKMIAEMELGRVLSDSDLFDIFDPEVDTHEFDEAYRQALYRGRPMLLGFGLRSKEEARALEMLGVNPAEAYARFEGAAKEATLFDKLSGISNMIAEGLPPDFGKQLAAKAENSLLMRAWLFKDPAAQAEWDNMVVQEIARFKQGGGAASQGGQLVGLLTPGERQSYG